MRKKASIVMLGMLLVLTSTNGAYAAPSITTQKATVEAAERRVNELQSRLARSLSALYALNDEVAAASGTLGVTTLRLRRAELRVQEAKAALSTRAREAYIRGNWRGTQLLFGLDSFVQVLTFGRYVRQAADADMKVYKQVQSARDELNAARNDADVGRREMLQATSQLESLRKEIQSTLAAEQAALSQAQAVLAQLEAARRKTISPAVEARRSARQVILDQRLAALLAWYAPGQGVEPFMPPNLRATGIVTNGLTSWYGPGFHGRRASSGATYRQEQLTAASLVLPFGTLLKVTFRGRSVVVVITDRGPYIQGRVLDLSAGAAQAIGVTGVKEVRMEIVTPTSPAPPFP